MGFFSKVVKSLAPKAGSLLKEMVDPESDFNSRSFLGLGEKQRIKRENNYADYLEAKIKTKSAKSRLDNFDTINKDMKDLEKRSKEIDLELRRLPITELETKMKLYEEKEKNKEAYDQLLRMSRGL